MTRLEQVGINFLLYDKRCDIISMERGLHDGLGRPDILGVTRDRKLIEIEIKVSKSDFNANFDKKIIRLYKNSPKYAPHFFYFLVPAELAPQIKDYYDERHINYGIIIPATFGVESVKKAKLNKDATKLSTKDMIQMVRNQTKTIWGSSDIPK